MLCKSFSTDVWRGGAAVGAADTRVQEVLTSNGRSVEPKMEPTATKAEGPAENLDVKGDMLRPSLANNKWVSARPHHTWMPTLLQFPLHFPLCGTFVTGRRCNSSCSACLELALWF